MIQFDEHIFQMGWLKPPTLFHVGWKFHHHPAGIFHPKLSESSVTMFLLESEIQRGSLSRPGP